MRHNKLAGTRFLLGSRKHKPSTFTSSSGRNVAAKDMLHSKSTYFYRWFGEHLDLTVSGLSVKTSYIVPAVCGAALLGALGIIVNPVIGNIETVYAATTNDKCMNGDDVGGVCPMELAIMMSGADGGTYEEAGATQLEAGKTSYRSYDFKISATDIDKDGYRLYATAVETKSGDMDYTNQLVNADYPDKGKFVPISNTTGVVGESMAAGEWGYAIAGGNTGNTLDTANTNPEVLTYKAVPTVQTTPIATGAETTTTDSGIPDNPATIPDEYKLIFGAKATEEMPSGHYRTQVMLSLVADPKNVTTTMQAFAAAKSCDTLEENESIQLLDDRTSSGIKEKKKYWVTKLKDGNCWMTQNLDLPLKQGDTLKSDDTDVSTNYAVQDLGNYRDPGMINYKTNAASASYANSECGDPASSSCASYFETYTGDIGGDEKAHYLIGNYYTWTVAMTGKTKEKSGSICPKGWHLSTRDEYSSLISGVSNSNATVATIRTSPYFFTPTGYYNESAYHEVAYKGYYWTSTPSSYYAYVLQFYVSQLFVYEGSRYNSPHSYSIRCLVSGT